MNNFREIVLAIEKYKDDIIKYPIFFYADYLNYLESDESIDSISKKLESNNYQPEYPEKFLVPYDTVSTRNAHNLNIDDHIIRYYLLNHLQKNIEIYTTKIYPENYKVYCVVDIFDCYNQIKREIFFETIESGYSNKIGEKYFNLLKLILNYKDQNSFNEVGLTIGNKTDEYFAELFLSYIHSEINVKVSENISRTGDEFLICANSINQLRDCVLKIDNVLLDYGLCINKSKNHINFINEIRNITRIIPTEVPWITAPSQPAPDYPCIKYNEVNYIKSFSNEQLEHFNLKIKSYEDSIKYLKLISPEINKIEILIKKYSSYSLYGFWDSSTPSEQKHLHKSINFKTVLNPEVLDNLETIIYRYPRSQYFSAMAIKNICCYAKNMDYSYENSCPKDENNAFMINQDDFNEYNSKSSSLLFEKSNSILLNAIQSEDIYDFQKYLILRELFFDKKSLTVTKENYKLSGEIPFPTLFDRELKKMLRNEYELELPLRIIINDILEV